MLSALGRITAEVFPSQPQSIILAGTQELVTQIADVVRVLGQEMGIRPRRMMSTVDKNALDSAGRGRGRGRCFFGCTFFLCRSDKAPKTFFYIAGEKKQGLTA